MSNEGLDMTATFQAAAFAGVHTRSPCGLPLACAVRWVAFSHLSRQGLIGREFFLMGFLFKLMGFLFKLMGFLFKLMGFLFKLMGFLFGGGRSWGRADGGRGRGFCILAR